MPEINDKLKNLLITAAKESASDLHIAVGRRPTLRIDGALVPLQQEPLVTPEGAEALDQAAPVKSVTVLGQLLVA